MNNKYQEFENQKEETDIPIGIPVNFNAQNQNGYDQVAASQIKFRKPTTNGEQQIQMQSSENVVYQPYFHQQAPYPQQGYTQQPQMYNQHPQGYPQQQHSPLFQQMAAQQMAAQRPQVFQPQNFDRPQAMKCPCCKLDILTIMNYESGNTTYLWAGGICCASLCCLGVPCCCCVPFMTNSCMDRSHYCPACGFNIIRKHRNCCQM